jgi:hypothetical protein
MKTKMILKTLGLAAVMAASTGALAHGWTNDAPRYGFPGYNNGAAFKESLALIKNVNDRQDQQLERILARYYEGRLTQAEFRKLMDEQGDIRKMERSFLVDGVLNRVEFQRLDHALDAASKHIFKEAHDPQGRPSQGYYGGDWNPGQGGHTPWTR